MEKIHIGLMLPASSILPISKDFETGLRKGLQEANKAGLQIEITKEFIGQGNISKTETALDKLIGFDGVDIVTGVLSNKVTERLTEKISAYKKPVIINNLGGNIPNTNCLNEYMFIHSMQLWQHAWALGNWGVRNIGKKGMFAAALYDSGYGFSAMFHEGMKAADAASDWSFSVAPLPNFKSASDISVIFPFIEKFQPDFVFAAFCGSETTLFINEFIRQGWHKKVKLLGLPFLLAPFKPVMEDVTIYTSSINEQPFATEQVFYYLGYQTAIAIVQATVASKDNDLQEQLSQNPAFVSLKTLTDSQPLQHEQNGIAIMENKLTANSENILQKKIDTSVTLSLKDEKLNAIISEIQIGWQNPYLCI